MATNEQTPNPWFDPAAGVELTERERKELMTPDDWDEVIDRYLAQEAPDGP